MSDAPPLTDAWTYRATVVTASDQLAEKVALFDESLHGLTEPVAPEDLIALAHHREETVAEFALLAKSATRGARLEQLGRQPRLPLELLSRWRPGICPRPSPVPPTELAGRADLR